MTIFFVLMKIVADLRGFAQKDYLGLRQRRTATVFTTIPLRDTRRFEPHSLTAKARSARRGKQDVKVFDRGTWRVQQAGEQLIFPQLLAPPCRPMAQVQNTCHDHKNMVSPCVTLRANFHIENIIMKLVLPRPIRKRIAQDGVQLCGENLFFASSSLRGGCWCSLW
jgi:hypothetical protein